MTRRTKKLRPAVAAALSAVLLVAGCGLGAAARTARESHQDEAPSNAALPETARSADVVPSPSGLPLREPFTPEAVATHWFIAYRTTSWTDAGPAAWVDRVRPYVTTTMHLRDEALRSGGGGADWDEFAAGRCVTRVSDVAALVPAEAPNTATVVYVELTGSVRTACGRRPPITPEEDAAATLTVTKNPDAWLVDERLY